MQPDTCRSPSTLRMHTASRPPHTNRHYPLQITESLPLQLWAIQTHHATGIVNAVYKQELSPWKDCYVNKRSFHINISNGNVYLLSALSSCFLKKTAYSTKLKFITIWCLVPCILSTRRVLKPFLNFRIKEQNIDTIPIH